MSESNNHVNEPGADLLQKAVDEMVEEFPGGDSLQVQADIRRQVQARINVENDARPEEPEEPELDSKFIIECFNANELGDGILFNALHKGKFVFCKSMETWLVWKGHHWGMDEMDSARSAVENVVALYLAETKKTSITIKKLKGESEEEDAPEIKKLKSLRSDLSKRAFALRTMRRRENCLKAAHTCEDPLAIHGTELDQMPWLLPCVNGVVDLKTGLMHPGRPEDNLLRACPTEFLGTDADRTAWITALMQIFENDDLVVSYIQRLFGMALVGGVIEHVFPVLTGPGGRNGKGTIIETISHVLGPLAAPIRSEMLIDSFAQQSSGGPTPDIMSLRGLRFAWASETKEGAKISAAKVKWLTGGDTITGRNPHDKYETTFQPTHTLFLLSNFKPHADVNDKAFWERMQNIPFNIRFLKNREPTALNEKPADLYLKDKLFNLAPGILGWMVEGCLEWQVKGLKPPPRVVRETQDYMDEEDNLGAFIEHCLISQDGLSIGATDLYETFEKWWQKYVGRFPWKQKKFGKHMRELFTCEKTGGLYRYFGVDLNKEWAESISN